MPVRPPMHRPAGWTPAPNKRPEAQDPFYGTSAWKRLRGTVIKRDGYQCTAVDCETVDRGRGGRLIAGHIVPRTKGGGDHPSNIKTFCPACDNRFHSEKGRLSVTSRPSSL